MNKNNLIEQDKPVEVEWDTELNRWMHKCPKSTLNASWYIDGAYKYCPDCGKRFATLAELAEMEVGK